MCYNYYKKKQKVDIMSKYETSGNPQIFGQSLYGVGEGSEGEEWHINPNGFVLQTEGVISHSKAYSVRDILTDFDKAINALQVEVELESKQPLMIQGFTRDGVVDLFDYTTVNEELFYVDIEIWINTHELILTDKEHKDTSKLLKSIKQAVKFLLLKLKNDLAKKEVLITVRNDC